MKEEESRAEGGEGNRGEKACVEIVVLDTTVVHPLLSSALFISKAADFSDSPLLGSSAVSDSRLTEHLEV